MRYDQDDCPGCGGRKQKVSVRCLACRKERYLDTTRPKQCPGCSRTLPAAAFGLRTDRNGARKLRSKCRQCEAKLQRRWERGNPRPKDHREATRRQAEIRLRSDPERYIQRALKIAARQRGVSAEEVLERWSRVGNLCEACGWTGAYGHGLERVQVDHDHSSGRFRGLLCGSCNRALAAVRDDPSLLRNLADYLTRT